MMRLLFAALLSLVPVSAFAQDWPNRPVTMVVPYAAGGPVDTVGRIMAQGLSEALGQQVIVENVGGAGGMTGANRVAKAAPDGYTFLLGGSATMTTVPALYGRKVLYNPLTDFEHVIQFADSSRVLIARKDFPVDNLKDFVAYAKAHTALAAIRLVRYRRRRAYLCAAARSGDGAQGYACALSRLGPGDAGPTRRALDYMCEQISTAVQQIKGGTVKPIALMGLNRSHVLPDLPTAAEQGFEINCASLSAFEFPKGTPEAIVQRLFEATNKAVDSVRARAFRGTRCCGRTAEAAYAASTIAKTLPPEVERQVAAMKASGLTAE